MRPFDLSGRETRSAASLAVVQDPGDRFAFMRNPDVRSALTNLERLHIVSDAEEVRPGLVRLSIVEMASLAQMEYHLSFLHGSYQAALPYGNEAVVELWSQGAKLGEYRRGGLIVGGATEPR